MKEDEKEGEEGSRKPKKSALSVSLCSWTDVDTDIVSCAKAQKNKSGGIYRDRHQDVAPEIERN